jgi:hypothetical protein
MNAPERQITDNEPDMGRQVSETRKPFPEPGPDEQETLHSEYNKSRGTSRNESLFGLSARPAAGGSWDLNFF